MIRVTRCWFKGKVSNFICKKRVWVGFWFYTARWEYEYWYLSEYTGEWCRVPNNYHFENEP